VPVWPRTKLDQRRTRTATREIRIRPSPVLYLFDRVYQLIRQKILINAVTVDHRHFGQTCSFQNGHRRISDLLEHVANPAGLFIGALGAAFVGHLTHTRQQSEGTVQRADQRTDGYGFGHLAEVIPATFTFLALQKALLLEFEENELQKLRRDLLALGDFADKKRSVAVLFGQSRHRLEPVFRLLRQHSTNSIDLIE